MVYGQRGHDSSVLKACLSNAAFSLFVPSRLVFWFYSCFADTKEIKKLSYAMLFRFPKYLIPNLSGSFAMYSVKRQQLWLKIIARRL